METGNNQHALVVVPPKTEEWQTVAAAFDKKWNFPHCVGAIDGKHIAIKSPPNSGSVFFNYKDFYSVILLAVVDAHYRFIWYQLGDNGRQNDAGVYAGSGLGDALANNTYHFPEPAKVGDYFFIVDVWFVFLMWSLKL